MVDDGDEPVLEDSATDEEVELVLELVMVGNTIPREVSAGDGGGVELSTTCSVLPIGTSG
jgi:hypothetical protein